jgi:hypothetical protein
MKEAGIYDWGHKNAIADFEDFSSAIRALKFSRRGSSKPDKTSTRLAL